jgi:signal transduction histidine kinase
LLLGAFGPLFVLLLEGAQTAMPKETLEILLIEDNTQDSSSLIQESLSGSLLGVRLTRVRRPREAMALLAEKPFDAAVVDLSGQNDRGLHTFRSIQASIPGVPLVVLMAPADVETGQEAVRHGAADYLLVTELAGPALWRVLRGAVERQRLAEQLHHAQNMEAVGRLASGVVHDFNNLLTAMICFSEVLLKRKGLAEPVRSGLHEIASAGRQAAGLSQQLLGLARKQAVEFRVLDLNTVVGDLVPLLNGALGEDVALVTDLDPGLRPVCADQGQLQQVILNLCLNARDAMPEGGLLVLTTRQAEEGALQEAPGYALLEVMDTGCGMDEPTRNRIFEPFFTTRSDGLGTGLGLANVQRIVQQCGGHISVRSELGRGSTFTIHLPCVDEPSRAPAPPPPSCAVLEPSKGEETVLVVEDEPAVCELVCLVLQQGGYKVLSASQEGEAVRLCQGYPGPIHLLITDLLLPRMNGRELAMRLRKIRPGLEVMFLSGDGNTAIRPSLGESNLIAKPLSATDLTRIVRQTLDRKAG